MLLWGCLLHVNAQETKVYSVASCTVINNGSSGTTTTAQGRYYMNWDGFRLYRQPNATSSISLTASTICESSGKFNSTTSGKITVDGTQLSSQYVHIFYSSEYDITSITMNGVSSSSSERSFTKVAVYTEDGTYPGETGDYTSLNTDDYTLTGSTKAKDVCGEYTFTCTNGTYIPKGTYIAILENGSGMQPSIITIKTRATGPSLSLSSEAGSEIQSVMQTESLTPIKYTLSGEATNASTTITWTGVTTYKPDWVTINTATEGIITISGSPATTDATGEYTYTITPSDGSSTGTAASGTLTVTAYEAPAPTIKPADGSGAASQSVKAGNAITSIVFDLTDASNATITSGDLPDNLSGIYNSENNTFTISGTVASTAALQAYPYTITLTASNGYSGEAVTESGVITVKDPNAKLIAYLTTSAKAEDDAIVTLLDGKYDVTKIYVATSADGKTVATGMTADVLSEQLTAGNYDLVVADEVLDGSNLNVILKAAFSKPFMNFKPFFYNSGRWGWGTGDNGKDSNGTLTVSEPNHPIFKNVTLSADHTVEMISGISGKVLQGATGVTTFGHNIGTVPPASGSAITTCIHELAAGSVQEGINVEGKYMLISMFNGAYSGLTEAGKTIILNACDYLMNDVVFGDGSPEGGAKFETFELINITPEVSGTTVTITWDPIPGAVKYSLTITGEELKSTQSVTADEPVIDGTSATITGLTQGYVYTYTLSAQNAAGVSVSKLNNTFTVNSPTGIGNIDSSKAIASETVYTLTGVQVKNITESGIYVKKVVYEDGTSETYKYIVK